MVNYALLNRKKLATKNYIRKADPQANYWFDFSAEKISAYKTEFGENFNLVVAGAEDDENDFL